jgi:hypothetical protein
MTLDNQQVLAGVLPMTTGLASSHVPSADRYSRGGGTYPQQVAAGVRWVV